MEYYSTNYGEFMEFTLTQQIDFGVFGQWPEFFASWWDYR